MKPVKQSVGIWQYALNQTESDLLCQLLNRFPVTENFPATISKTDEDPKTVEREKLLNEAMAEHRKELLRQAANLTAGNKLKRSGKRQLLTLTAEEREALLQILNDIRVGCWYSLGKPESLDLQKLDGAPQKLSCHSLMSLAGYFEHHLIGTE